MTTIAAKPNDVTNHAARQLFEGARPTLERLAAVSRQLESELRTLAQRENWRPMPEAKAIRRRIAAMTDRALALMEEADGDEVLAKTRLDAITALLKAMDKLREVADIADERDAAPPDERELTSAFSAIDQRIEELAHAYAEKLVEAASDARANPPGADGVVPEGQG
jgi:hypothetical protein